MCVFAWCHVMDWCSIQGVFPPHAWCSQALDLLQQDKDELVNEHGVKIHDDKFLVLAAPKCGPKAWGSLGANCRLKGCGASEMISVEVFSFKFTKPEQDNVLIN